MYNHHKRSLAIHLLLACAGILAAAPLAAQPGEEADSAVPGFALRVGPFADYQLIQHEASIATLPGVFTCAPAFSGSGAGGFAAGGLFELGLRPELALQARLGYSSFDAHFSQREDIGNVVVNSEVVSAISEHAIDLDVGLVTLEARAVWQPLSFPLALNLGLQGGTMLTRDAGQVETLVSPEEITFYGGYTWRNRYQGDLPGAVTFQLYGVVGLSYELALSPYVIFSPEVIYNRAFTALVEDSVWSAHALRIGASVKFRLNEAEPIPPPPPPPTLAASVTATGLLADGTERPVPQLRVEEFLTSQLWPLLNYVFFPQGRADIPGRYVRMEPERTRTFKLDELRGQGVLSTYHQVLNVLGLRLRENPEATIRLVGTNEGVAEKGNQELSRRRAEAVRDYLRDVWGIDESRMRMEARNLPEKASNTSQPEGQEENRRVEIYAEPATLLDPVFISDTLRNTNPPAIRFRQSVQADAGVARWKLLVYQQGRKLKEFSGTGSVPEIIDWSLERQADIPRGMEPIEYRIEVEDTTGQVQATPTARLPIDQVTIQKKRRERIADKEIDRYSLILFDFGKTTLSDANRRIIDFIRQRISPEASVVVTGHSDRVGDEDVNLRLSAERARVAAQALDIPVTDVQGLGESVILYDNDLPEGRLYSRVVNVVVETSVNE